MPIAKEELVKNVAQNLMRKGEFFDTSVIDGIITALEEEIQAGLETEKSVEFFRGEFRLSRIKQRLHHPIPGMDYDRLSTIVPEHLSVRFRRPLNSLDFIRGTMKGGVFTPVDQGSETSEGGAS